MAGYTQLERDLIINGAEERFFKLVLDALCRDDIGCCSDEHWRVAWNIDSIFHVLGSTLTAVQENCLLERLIDYKTKPLD